jgi:hypothetical protein
VNGYQTYFSYDLPPVPRDDDLSVTVQWLTGSLDPALATPVDFTGYQGGLFCVWDSRDRPPLCTGTVALLAGGYVTATLGRDAVAAAAPGARYYSLILIYPDGTHHTLMRGNFTIV